MQNFKWQEKKSYYKRKKKKNRFRTRTIYKNALENKIYFKHHRHKFGLIENINGSVLSTSIQGSCTQ